MAPEHPYVQGGYVAFGSIWGAYLPIIDGLRDDLTEIHVQYYNNGSFTYDNASNQMVQEGTVDGLVAGSLMLIRRLHHGLQHRLALQRPAPRPGRLRRALGLEFGEQRLRDPAVISNSLNCLTRLTGCNTIKPAKAYPTFRGGDDLVDQLGQARRLQLLRAHARGARRAALRAGAAPRARALRTGSGPPARDRCLLDTWIGRPQRTVRLRAACFSVEEPALEWADALPAVPLLRAMPAPRAARPARLSSRSHDGLRRR